MKLSLAIATTLASGLILNAAAQVPAAPAPADASAPASVPAAPAGPAKIAVVAFQVAVAQTNEGQRNFADLQKKYDPKRQQLKGLNDEIETLTKQLQTQGDKLSETEKASRAKTIDEKKKQL
jgi:outer membrane protein